MRVLMINSVCGILSTGRICTDLAELLNKQGHEVKIAYGRGVVPKKYKKYAVKIGSKLDVIFHGILSRIFDFQGLGSKFSTKKLIKWIKKFKPDVIHLHNLHGYYINIEVLFNYIKTCDVKIIWTLHDCWAYTGHCAHYDFIKCNKWEYGCYQCSGIHNYPKSFFDRSKFNWLKKKELFTNVKNMIIVTPSNWLKNNVKKSFLKNYDVYVINNGIDLNIFNPKQTNIKERYGIKEKRVILGVSAKWDEKKGLNDFITLSKYLDNNYIIVLIGLTKTQTKKMPNNILGLRRTNDVNSLVEWYCAADVFVNASVEETMGLTTIEALSCGTPVIVYNKTAVPEMVDSSCGIVLKNNNPKEILKNLNNINFDFNKCILHAKKFEKSIKYNEYFKLYGCKK